MVKIVTFNTKKDGLRTILKEYQEVALKYMWSLKGGGASSRDVWVGVNDLMRTDESARPAISRASIINFMNSMVDEGAVSYTEITGKGGHRRIYAMKFDEPGFRQFISNVIMSKLIEISRIQD